MVGTIKGVNMLDKDIAALGVFSIILLMTVTYIAFVYKNVSSRKALIFHTVTHLIVMFSAAVLLGALIRSTVPNYYELKKESELISESLKAKTITTDILEDTKDLLKVIKSSCETTESIFSGMLYREGPYCSLEVEIPDRVNMDISSLRKEYPGVIK